MNDDSFRFLAQHYFPVKVYLANFSSITADLRAAGTAHRSGGNIFFNSLTSLVIFTSVSCKTSSADAG
jgi:hypothetical protein